MPHYYEYEQQQHDHFEKLLYCLYWTSCFKQEIERHFICHKMIQLFIITNPNCLFQHDECLSYLELFHQSQKKHYSEMIFLLKLCYLYTRDFESFYLLVFKHREYLNLDMVANISNLKQFSLHLLKYECYDQFKASLRNLNCQG